LISIPSKHLETFNYFDEYTMNAMSDDNLEAYLAQHPRVLGVLFTALLLAGAGTATVAAHGSTTAGP
jgi:hypothetical protein